MNMSQNVKRILPPCIKKFVNYETDVTKRQERFSFLRPGTSSHIGVFLNVQDGTCWNYEPQYGHKI